MEHTNYLINENSPYLLQHAHNPVDWYPWGEAAFAKAKAEDKPIFLSIGYSTCHWCHVMEKEDFEDAEGARLMNDAFVNIKVDREERPDIDAVYMSYAQLTGSGGWPLTIVMTPDKKPFFAATFIPKESRYGRTGMLELIPRLKKAWADERADVLSAADNAVIGLKKMQNRQNSSHSNLDAATMQQAFSSLIHSYDPIYGGFGKNVKFPAPHNILFLLRYGKRTGDARAMEMVENTLSRMQSGGFFDQIGYGFHRYSTTRDWNIPHFEKMLYDQADLAVAYIEAYQATKMAEYAAVAEKIFEYVLRDLKADNGAFYSAEDADVKGAEGVFYLWKAEEFDKLLSPADAAIAKQIYHITAEGNYKEVGASSDTGLNIPYMGQSIDEWSGKLSIPRAALVKQLKKINNILREYRSARHRLFTDTKILTGWNGLMIAALAKGGRVFGKHKYIAAAEHAADFFIENMADKNGRVMHQYAGGQAEIPGFAEDYSFLVYGLIELYETTFKPKYLSAAVKINSYFMKSFMDETHGGFFMSEIGDSELPVPQKEIIDGAVPSGNSVEYLNLLRLADLTGHTEYSAAADKLAGAFANIINSYPAQFTQFLCGLDYAVGPAYELVIVSDSKVLDNSDLKKIYSLFAPNKAVIYKNRENEADRGNIAPFLKEYKTLDGKTTYYLCRDFVCAVPTTKLNDIIAALGN